MGTCALYNVNAPFDGLVVAKDSPITTGADFNGKTVSTQSLNDVGQVAESAWVDQHGGDSKTIHFVEIPTSAAAAAVESHRVDSAILLEPVLSASMANGKLRLLGHAFGSIAPAFLFAAWFTTNDFAAQHVDAIRKFVTVIYQAGAYTNTHHKEAAAIVAQQIKVPVDIVQNAQWSVAGTSLDANQIQPVIDTRGQVRHDHEVVFISRHGEPGVPRSEKPLGRTEVGCAHGRTAQEVHAAVGEGPDQVTIPLDRGAFDRGLDRFGGVFPIRHR